MVIGGVATIITGGFPQFIRGIFCIVFGIIVFVFEFRLPPVITQHVSYMFSFLGRGLFYIFIGCIILNEILLAIASGVIVALAGVAYSILQFMPFVQPPINMRREAFDDSLEHKGNANQWNTSPLPTTTTTTNDTAAAANTTTAHHTTTNIVPDSSAIV
ncbi:COPI associated protein-domain-containing protein [Spinellus fusiger]|nr:COPI associated protein-domain-containing protein [Spinellus fusiger]